MTKAKADPPREKQSQSGQPRIFTDDLQRNRKSQLKSEVPKHMSKTRCCIYRRNKQMKKPNRVKSLKMLDAQIMRIDYKIMIYEIIFKIKSNTEMTLKFSFMRRAERF